LRLCLLLRVALSSAPWSYLLLLRCLFRLDSGCGSRRLSGFNLSNFRLSLHENTSKLIVLLLQSAVGTRKEDDTALKLLNPVYRVWQQARQRKLESKF
jgi:hypothetical protein